MHNVATRFSSEFNNDTGSVLDTSTTSSSQSIPHQSQTKISVNYQYVGCFEHYCFGCSYYATPHRTAIPVSIWESFFSQRIVC